jgi:hypothetical protein
MAATMAQRIQDLIGFDYASNSINSEDEAIETAAAEVIDLVPTSLLLKYAVAPADLYTDNTTYAVEGKKILRVIRFDAQTVGRVCEKVDIDTFKEITKGSDSVYLPTKHSPIWTEDPETGTTLLNVFPIPTAAGTDLAEAAKVYYITYPIGASTDSLSAIDGLPNELEHAIALKASSYILQTMISDAVQDDEDNEMQSMLSNQSQSLQASYQAEMQRITGEKGDQIG